MGRLLYLFPGFLRQSFSGESSLYKRFFLFLKSVIWRVGIVIYTAKKTRRSKPMSRFVKNWNMPMVWVPALSILKVESLCFGKMEKRISMT